MKQTNKITNSPKAVYIGKSDTCLSCKFRLEDLKLLESKMLDYDFYYMNATDVEDLIQEYKINAIPFFIVSKEGKIVSIFYSYENLKELYYKIVKEG